MYDENANYINCSLMRGGTSKGLMFLEEDLPSDEQSRHDIFLKLLGSPDKFINQVQSLGGGKSTNNKIGVVKKSSKYNIDLDFTFYQIHPNSSIVDTLLNCGNFISTVPVFAIMKNLVSIETSNTMTKIYNENTKQVVHATIQTNKRGLLFEGNYKLDGVSGEFPPIELKFVNIDREKIFPTGNLIDEIEGIKVTILNITVAMIIIDGDDLSIDAQTIVSKFKNKDFLKKIQTIRKKSIELMKLSEEYINFSTPKITVICKSNKDFSIKSYYYDPFTLHDSHAVTGGICLAGACLLKNTVASKFFTQKIINGKNSIKIEHQSGSIEIDVDFHIENQVIESASVIRTASMLMDGKAYLYN